MAISNPTADSLINWGVDHGKVCIVHHCLDYDEVLRESEKEPESLPPGSGQSIKILVPGQLLRTKGQHTAIQAAELLKGKGYDFVMWIVGGTRVCDDSSYQEYLEHLIFKGGLEKKVFLLGRRSDIPSLMRLANIVAFPTHTEGLPRVVLEAMALKRPVVSTPVGGILDLIVDGETGLLVPIDEPQALAEKIERLILNKELSSDLVYNAQGVLFEHFSLDKYIESVKSGFELARNSKQGL
jgi:glycosyltransferase involved in cell wall biosynthesis